MVAYSPAASFLVRSKVSRHSTLDSSLAHLSGGLFPGIILYYSGFYKRYELQFRFALMFSVTSLAGAFSGLLAAAILNLDGERGLAGWAWIFILVSSSYSSYFSGHQMSINRKEHSPLCSDWLDSLRFRRHRQTSLS